MANNKKRKSLIGKLFKFVIILGFIFAALGVVAFFAVRHYYPPEKIKKLALNTISTKLKREVSLKDAQITWKGVSLRDIAISEYPNFNKGIMFKAKEIELAPNLLALLTLELRFSLNLDNLTLNVKQHKNQTFNFSDMMESDSQKQTADTKKSGFFIPIRKVSIGKVSLENSKINYTDMYGSMTAVRDINLSAQNVSLTNASQLEAKFVIDYPTPKSSMRIPVDGKFTIYPAKGNFEKAGVKISSLQIRPEGIPIDISGKMDNLLNPYGTIEVKNSGFNLKDLNLQKHFTAVQKPYNVIFPKMSLNATFKKNDNLVSVSKLIAKMGDIELSGNIDASKQGKIWNSTSKFELKPFDVSFLNTMFPVISEYQMGGNAKGNLTFKTLPGKFLYNGTFGFDSGKIEYGFYRISETKGTMDFDTENIVIKKLTGKINDSPFDSSLFIKMFASAKNPNLPDKINLKTNLDIDKIEHPNFMGQNINVNCDLTDITPKKDEINGTASLIIKDGYLKDLTKFSKSNGIGEMFLIPFMILQKVGGVAKVPVFPDFNNINYSRIEGQYAFKNGIMNVLKSELDSDVALSQTTGTVNLASEKLDLKITTKLRGTLAGKIPAPIVMNVKGTIKNPSVKLDVKSIVLQPKIKDTINSALDDGKKLLKGLFK
jgi:hypothetical protein